MKVNTPPELAALRDIHLPKAIGWWPLAPGWYVLIGLVLLASVSMVYFIHRRRLKTRAKRQALQLLATYQKQHLESPNCQQTCARISELLKRVAMAYYPRERVAGLQGTAWLEFLNRASPNVDFSPVQDELLRYPYHPKANSDLTTLFQLAKAWITHCQGGQHV